MKKLLLAFVLVLYLGNLFVKSPLLATAASDAATPSAAPREIEYPLPYPGSILPDNPFYFLKVIRDNITIFFLRDPLQRSFYFLFLADKRLASAQSLLDKNKSSLAATTVLKSQENLSHALIQASRAKEQGREVVDLFTKLTVAAAKHEEVISKLATKVKGEDSNTVQKAYRENLAIHNRVREFLLDLTNPKK